jgi:hypothetical protein
MARKRARARRGGEREPDRLSALPDCLLHTIMSSLKARQAVQTCVLSRRWRHLWRSVPCLDVDINEFRADAVAPDFDNNNAGDGSEGDDIPEPEPSNDSSDSDGGNSENDNDSSDLEDDTSSASDMDTIDSYWLSSSDDDDNEDKQNAWERFENFTVNFWIPSGCTLIGAKAPSFGARQAAGWLRRAMKYCTPFPPAPRREGSSSASWLLKRQHLCYVRLDGCFAEHVSSVCRSLEDLELDSCTCRIQSITSHSLKTLVLKKCRWFYLSEITSPTLKTLIIDGGSNAVDSHQLVILAPAVTYLHLDVHVYLFCGGISINEMPSLAKTLIYLRGHKNLAVPSSSNLGGNQLKLLCGLSNVTNLELYGVGRTVCLFSLCQCSISPR